MAKSEKTAQEFIQSSFSPVIAVLCSPKIDSILNKNNLTFSELLEPFTTLDWEGQFREPGGSLCSVRNWKIIIKDVNWKPLQPTEARKELNNAVLLNFNDRTVSIQLDGQDLDIPHSTPWFDAWRETYFEVQFPSDHEFTKHFLSCILVGNANDDNIIDTFNSLNQQYAQLQNLSPPKLPKWFNSSVLKTYLLLHDVSTTPREKADGTLETLKQNFGTAGCFMLSINSKSMTDPPLSNDFWVNLIKRTSTNINSEMSSSFTASPLDNQNIFTPQVVVTESSAPPTSSPNQETTHPLTTAEVDVYDSANSLQTHSFSGSSESVNVIGKPLDPTNEVHGSALSSADVDAIKIFLQKYASKALLPYLEKQIAQLTEVVANRKGVSRSLLSATKRWFGTGKGGSATSNNAVIYSNDCPELQQRRLGDLWFLCGQWQRAFDAYHTAKREFYADSAWLWYAGALEMAAVSAFMAGEASRKTHGYMDESIVTYLNTCRMVQYAVRATLLSVLCLKGCGLHGEAAKQLIRMTSEDSDLRSAMLLEQAALCFLQGPANKAMSRKYAFHMVLAGHRCSKAGQKKHAYRCYKQAYQVYKSSGWRLSTDHVQFALGRLAGALRLTGEAVRWLAEPLAPAAAHQAAHQQDAFLREYMLAHQQWVESTNEFKECLPVLPLPVLESGETAVLCVGPAPLSAPARMPATSLALSDAEVQSHHEDRYWHKLEEMLLQIAQGSVPMIFRPTVDLYTSYNDGNPVVPQGEPIQISITLRNPLKISLILKDVELLWRFTNTRTDGDDLTGEIVNEPATASGSALENSVIVGQKIQTVHLEGENKKILTFLLTPLRVGQLVVQAVAYKLINPGERGTENGVTSFGKVNLVTDINEVNKRINITVVPPAPCLQMTFSETSSEVVSGELRSVDMELRNVGPVDMGPVHLAVSHPDCVCLATGHADDFHLLYDDKYREAHVYTDERAARTAAWRAAAARHVGRASGGVPRGGCARARLLLRPRASVPVLYLLAYYESNSHARGYRLLRHVFRFKVTEVVDITVSPRRSLHTAQDNVLENMNLSVEVKNIGKDKAANAVLEVLEGSLLSRQWTLTNLTGESACLNSHEKLHLVFKATRIRELLEKSQLDWSCLKVVEDSDSKININEPPYSKFVTDYKSQFIDAPEVNLLNMEKKGLIQSMFILRWRVRDKKNSLVAIGQHNLWLECFTKALSKDKDYLSPETPSLQLDDYESKSDILENKNKIKKDNVVLFKMEHPHQIEHDFKERKLCLVPVTVYIVNCCVVPVKVFIDFNKLERVSVGEVGWAGALSEGSSPEGRSLGIGVSLAALETRRVLARAVCAAPGTYLLGAGLPLAVIADRADSEETLATHCANDSTLLIIRAVEN